MVIVITNTIIVYFIVCIVICLIICFCFNIYLVNLDNINLIMFG